MNSREKSSNKIVFVICGKSPISMPGGLGAYGVNLGKILSSLGYRVYLLGFNDRAEETALEFGTLIHVKNPFARLFGLGSFFSARIFSGVMERKLSEHTEAKEVLVYSVGVWGMAGVYFANKLNQNRIRTVISYFDTLDHDFTGQVRGTPVKDYGLVTHWGMRFLHLLVRLVYTPMERKILEGTERIVIHYESTRKILIEQFPELRAKRFFKIPYCVEMYEHVPPVQTTESVSFVSESSPLPLVGLLCRQDPRKGVNVFLYAVRLLRDRGVRFRCVIAGAGIFLERHKRLARKLELTDQIEFAGFVPSTEAFLRKTDIYVLPSFEEGAGALSLLEAMKMGVAIVTTDCDGIPEDFTSEQNALLVPSGDSEKMAEALTRLIQDSSLRKRFAEQAKADYERKFSFEEMARGMTSVLARDGETKQ